MHDCASMYVWIYGLIQINEIDGSNPRTMAYHQYFWIFLDIFSIGFPLAGSSPSTISTDPRAQDTESFYAKHEKQQTTTMV
jgi:hypothetical protein